MTKLFKKILPFMFALLLGSASVSLAAPQLHYLDTLKNESERVAFRAALKAGPECFVCQDYQTDGKSYVEAKGLVLNKSIKNLLSHEAVFENDTFWKKVRRIHAILKPLGITGDLKVTYRVHPMGYIVDYYISDIRIWGKTAGAKVVGQIQQETD